ncbi:MAG TPA: HNH endonuclease [Mycobacteriales bacterium]|nr:HNH endonuclease [Mycobacteriales bacterium]
MRRRRRSVSSLSVNLPDGYVLSAGRHYDLAAPSVQVTTFHEIKSRIFDVCPICGALPTREEHVPPLSMGGAFMTKTCEPCNSRLGSYVEADLADWLNDVLTFPTFSADGVRGGRRSGRVFFRITPNGEFIFLMDGRFDPAISIMLEGGRVKIVASFPDVNRYRLALLKHAYLAGCLDCGIPQADNAELVRGELIAARDARSRHEVPRSPLALGLTVLKLDGHPSVSASPIVKAVAQLADGPCEGVVLAGRVFVSWMSQPPANDELVQPSPLRLEFAVGGKVDGIVASVEAAS